MGRVVGAARLVAVVAAATVFTAGGHAAAADAPLRFDHLWVVVSPGAPQRTALERAGFRFSEHVNRHDGQGTASITIDFDGSYIELIWPDDTVPVSPGSEITKQKFVNKMRWRETGFSPFGVGVERTSSTPPNFPFDTWKVTSDWMGQGQSIEMLTPKEMPTALSVFIPVTTDDVSPDSQPNGVKRITSVKVFAPNASQLPPSAAYVNASGAAQLEVGTEWLADVTFDNGAQKQTRDLRPDLPMIVHY